MKRLETTYRYISGIILLSTTIGAAFLLINEFRVLSYASNNKPLLLRFSSYQELRDYLNRTPPYRPRYRGGVFPEAVTFTADAKAGVSLDYSKTNIQVEGVDEADIVKCDGEYIYIATAENLIIVRAYPPMEAKVLTRIVLNETIRGIFVNKNRLIIFSESPYWEVRPLTKEIESLPIFEEPRTSIKVYNIEDRANPLQVRDISLNGSYFDARLIGDYVYTLVNQPAFVYKGEVILPTIKFDDEVKTVEAPSIYYANVSDWYYAYTMIIAINTQKDEEKPTYETFLIGATGEIYVSANNIYIAIPSYDENSQSEETEIHRILIENNRITYEASGKVPGYVLNQFSMDEYEGHFRIATTISGAARNFKESYTRNHIYVLDMNLNIVGKIEDIAPEETIYSARFMGRRCYLVTFRKVDPLFVIDLGEPTNPIILGKLKITGYSDYLHPYDETHIIGVGKETIPAEEGDFAWYQGIKISLFDVADVENPKEIAKYEIGDRGTDSPILRDHKALLFDKNRNLLAIPVLVAEIDKEKYPGGVPPYAYGEFVWQGAYIFNVTESGITVKGRITHVEDSAELLKSSDFFFSQYSIERSLYIEDVLYTISSKKIKMNNLTDLQEIGEVELP